MHSLLLVWVLGFSHLALEQQVPGSGSETGSEHELRNLERDWDAAIIHKDVAALDRILSDDFVYIDSVGGVNPKIALIHGIKDSDATIEPFETTEVNVRIYDDTAILTGRFAQKTTYKGQSFSGQFRYTDVYVKQGGTWRAVSAHASRIPDKKKGE